MTCKLCLAMQCLRDDARLVALNDVLSTVPPEVSRYVHVSDEKEPIMVWGRRTWEKALELAEGTASTHIVFLQEDIALAQDFWTELPNMICARPDDILALHTPHWKFEQLWMNGADWAITWDGLIGNAYVLPVQTVRDLLRFMDEDVKPAANAYHSEDGMIATFAMANRRPILHPMPSPIDHLHVGKSLYAHDEDAFYRPVMRWNLGGLRWPKSWDTKPAVLGLVYRGEHWRLRNYLEPEAARKYSVIEHMYELEAAWKNSRTPRG
jgi:hypothetical protein